MYSRQGSVFGHGEEIFALGDAQVPCRQVLLAVHDERAMDDRGTRGVALTEGYTDTDTNHPL